MDSTHPWFKDAKFCSFGRLHEKSATEHPVCRGLTREAFPTSRNPGIQMQLQQWMKGTLLLLELTADLAVTHMLLVWQAYRMQDLQSHGGFHSDFKGRPGDQALCGRVELHETSP
jgi:hypothetical protein